ncbi:MAG: type IV pilus assembly protein FimV, partial [Burkholderiales bacterium]
MREYSLKTWLVAACMVLLVPHGAHAAGLGRLTVLSALGQTLNAEIELLSVKRGETITARLAPQEVYQQLNAQFNPSLIGTRITVQKRPNGDLYLRATSPRPVSEPFLELVVELNSESGRVTRQYTALLDPPGYGRAAGEIPPPAQPGPPAVAAPQAPAATAAEPTAEAAPAPAEPTAAALAPAPPAPAATPARPSPAAAATGPRQYGPIKTGETLGRIARIVKPEGATLEQTLVALHRHNPDAFIKKNMNLVKSGKILNVPEASEISALAQPEAVREVRLQVADFNAFRNRVAERAASAPDADGTTRGRIGPAVTNRAAAEPKDTVRLSRGEPAEKGGKASAEARVRALEEEAIARQKALADANERISQLE